MEFTEGDVSLVLSALKFSAERHRNQRRKDVEATPYINHPIIVAELLWRVGKVREVDTVSAALLHDIIEDTETKPQEIACLFGQTVLSLVLEVTDDKSLPKRERKRLQIEHAPHLTLPAKLIKIADKISNVVDITQSPPRDWTLERRREYLVWTQRVVEGLRGCNDALESYYDRVLEEGMQRL